MERLVKRSILGVFMAGSICLIISALLALYAPHVTNSMAMGQLVNDNAYWTAMEAWNGFVRSAGYLQAGIMFACAGNIAFNTIKYFKELKGKN